MPRSLTKSQIDKLGERLRRVPPDAADLDRLRQLMLPPAATAPPTTRRGFVQYLKEVSDMIGRFEGGEAKLRDDVRFSLQIVRVELAVEEGVDAQTLLADLRKI